MDDSVHDWKKLKQNSEKVGYREGIEEGRLSNFQNSFDQGYVSGFKNGFELGKIKAELRRQNHPEVEHTRKGDCILCKDQALMEKSNEEKQLLQSNCLQNTISSIKERN